MGQFQHAGRFLKGFFERTLGEFPSSVTAHWSVTTGGTYDYTLQAYVGATSSPNSVNIPAVVETDKLKYRYEKYGINEETDIVAMVSVDQAIPPGSVTYTRQGDSRTYFLVESHNEGNYGCDPTGKELFAYKNLHLRAN